MEHLLHFTVPDVSKDHSVLVFKVKKSVAARNGVLITFALEAMLMLSVSRYLFTISGTMMHV